MNGWTQVYNIEFIYSYSYRHTLHITVHHEWVSCSILVNRTSSCKPLSPFSTMQTVYLLALNIFFHPYWTHFHFQTSPTRTCVVPEGTFLDYTHILSTCRHCGGGWWSGVMLPWKVECLTKMLRITVAIYVWISEYMKINKCKIGKENVQRARSATGQVTDWWDYPPAWSVYL